MASIRHKNGVFEARVIRKGYPAKSRSFPTKKEAQAWVAEYEGKILRRRSVQTGEGFTVLGVLDEYTTAKLPTDANGKRNASDEAEYGRIQTLAHHFRDIPVIGLNAERLERFIDGMATLDVPPPPHRKKAHPLFSGTPRKYAQATIRRLFYTLKVILIWHSDKNNYELSPKLFKVDNIPSPWSNVRDRRLEDDEEERLIDACRNILTRDAQGKVIRSQPRAHGDVYAMLVIIAIETAGRLSELTTMSWRDLDLNRRIWIIPAEKSKTKKTRTVELSLIAVTAFNFLRAETRDAPFEKLPKKQARLTTWRRIVKDAKITDLRFHDLRHEAISRWVIQGGGDHKISQMAGHRLGTMERYVKLRVGEMSSFIDG